MSDLIDSIDELVDEQLAGGEPLNGFDFGDPEYPRCPHCGRHWHGLPITQRIARMYAVGRYDPEYTLAEDDSPILCDGSDFIGPIRPAPGFDASRIVNVIGIRIVPVPDFSGFAHALLQLQQQWESFAAQLLGHGIGFVGIRPGAPWVQFQQLTYDEPHQLTECAPPPEGITIEFGPRNWHYTVPRRELARPMMLTATVYRRWHEFTVPNFPVPERPGYDFSRYANDPDPTWVPSADTHTRRSPRPGHTTARQRRRGRSQHGG